MNIKKTTLVISILISLLACKPEYTKNKTILEAEKVMFSSPDSAYKLLKSINQPEKLPEADYAAWCLHYVHAKFKLYIDDKKDTNLLKFATDYFQKNGSEKYLGTAYYLNGRIANDIENKKLLLCLTLKKPRKFLKTLKNIIH